MIIGLASMAPPIEFTTDGNAMRIVNTGRMMDQRAGVKMYQSHVQACLR
jgi:hypothetical protein